MRTNDPPSIGRADPGLALPRYLTVACPLRFLICDGEVPSKRANVKVRRRALRAVALAPAPEFRDSRMADKRSIRPVPKRSVIFPEKFVEHFEVVVCECALITPVGFGHLCHYVRNIDHSRHRLPVGG
jgi:hypothetical protein